jgi:nitrite reductase (NADH) large subunit
VPTCPRSRRRAVRQLQPDPVVEFLAGSDDPAEIYLNGLDWYSDNRIDLRAGVRVVRVDTFAHVVHADDGASMSYDKLILATGSR